MYLYIQVSLFIGRPVRSIKKLLWGEGGEASNQFLVLQSAKYLSWIYMQEDN